jgi:hypothetical protein
MIPLGLASLAATVREEGYSVRIVDAWAEGLRTPEFFRRRLNEKQQAVVKGLTMVEAPEATRI